MAEPLLDRRLLERLERLTLRWHKSFRGLVGGRNLSRYSGPGLEFLDHRRFHQGDDLRAVNWRAYLRLEKLFLKMFQTEPRTPIRMLLDISPSMTASPSPGDPDKFLYARRLAAALTYVALVRHDTVILLPYHERLGDPCTASGGRHRFGPVNDFLAELEPAGRSNLLQTARQFISNYPKPGLLVILSDFLDEGDVLKPLQYLADFGHELLAVHIYTESERAPSLSGETTLEDSETGAQLQLSLDPAACRAYTEAFDLYASAIEHLVLRAGGRYAAFSTSIPLDDAILEALDLTGAELQRAARGA
ncbi:MAG: DUF58 domain-containing protein [Bryobacteraceae bacterium]